MLVARKNPKRRAPRLRNPERTRQRLLQAAFREIYRYGFQSAGIDTILAATNVTKGALYYHFDSKETLGYAIIEEIVAKWSPLTSTSDASVDVLADYRPAATGCVSPSSASCISGLWLCIVLTLAYKPILMPFPPSPIAWAGTRGRAAANMELANAQGLLPERKTLRKRGTDAMAVWP
jgi:AcrR family transcriptional regulator